MIRGTNVQLVEILSSTLNLLSISGRDVFSNV